ncbi:MAG TPA: helix-turn-helix domain-containing protein, partial [Sandaracinaceae bacterium]
KVRELGGAPPPLDLWRRLEDDGDPLADLVREEMEAFSPCFVLNQTRLRADLELGEAIRTASRRRLGIAADYLGHIDYDDTVWASVRMRRLLLVETPGTKSAKNIEKIARRILAIESGKARRRSARGVPPESHHDLLEVERGATDEEIRRAFKRAKEIYAPDALCCYGLFEPHELEKVRLRLEEAHDVLLDPARRRPYELSVFPMAPDETEEQPRTERSRADLPPPPEITPDTEFTGTLIRQVRESQGIELKDISQRTKVGIGYLRAIEEDDYASLPAPVYVRGFVAEMAKCLRLDAAQVSRTYVKRFRRYLEERGQT